MLMLLSELLHVYRLCVTNLPMTFLCLAYDLNNVTQPKDPFMRALFVHCMCIALSVCISQILKTAERIKVIQYFTTKTIADSK